jgi:uncharacterized membrane protein YjdF
MKKLSDFLTVRLSSDKIRTGIILSYIALSLASSVYSLILGSYRNALLSLGYPLLIVFAITVFEYFVGIRFGKTFLLVFFIIPVGAMLGSCYNMYTLIPMLDTVLHTVSGFVFAAFGYSLMMALLKSTDKRGAVAAILFAVAFSIGVAAVWELLEWFMSEVAGADMHEDQLVDSFSSYLLSGTHDYAFTLDNIERTEIYYQNGKVLTVNGYIDLGLYDTLVDMLVCCIGAVIYFIPSLVGALTGHRTADALSPSVARGNSSE